MILQSKIQDNCHFTHRPSMLHNDALNVMKQYFDKQNVLLCYVVGLL